MDNSGENSIFKHMARSQCFLLNEKVEISGFILKKINQEMGKDKRLVILDLSSELFESKISKI